MQLDLYWEGQDAVTSGKPNREGTTMTTPTEIIPYGLCHCGCGQKTKISPITDAYHGWIRGVPRKYVRRHHPMPKKHGHSMGGKNSPTLSSWNAMVDRCTNPKATKFPQYGGSGITVCERWMKFENFLADMGIRPQGTTLDRKNGSKGYEPGNCRWATLREQQSNIRSNRNFLWHGKVMILSEIARQTGIHRNTLDQRLAIGLTIDEAVAYPFNKKRPYVSNCRQTAIA